MIAQVGCILLAIVLVVLVVAFFLIDFPINQFQGDG